MPTTTAAERRTRTLPRALVVALAAAVPLALCAAPTNAQATSKFRSAGHWGIGLGSSTAGQGVSLKYFVSDVALQGTVGSWGGYDGVGGIRVGVDGLYEMPIVASTPVVDLGWNLGVGAGVGLADGGGFGLAASGVLGLELNFVPIPLDVVLEYRPGVGIVPDVDIDVVGFSGHIRWYF